MDVKKVCPIAITIAALLMVCAPVFAHHGTGTSYDGTKSVAITGVVNEFVWSNPHSQLFLDVTEEQGAVVRWGLEMGSPGSLVRAGWTKRSLKPGDKVTVTMHPSLAGTHVGAFQRVVLSDGTILSNQAEK